MARYHYTYLDFKQFPGASEASRRVNLIGFPLGLILTVAAIIGFSGGVAVGILSIAAAWFVNWFFIRKIIHDRPVLKAMFAELSEISEAQQQELVSHFMRGKRIGTGDLKGACSVAAALLEAELGLKNEEYSKKEYNEIRHGILIRNSIQDLDYGKQVFQDEPEYCFEDVSEYRLFTKLHGKVHWKKSDSSYADLLKEASENVKDKNYRKAIECYKKSFDINPIALSARFGCVNALIQMEKYDEAQIELSEVGNYLEKMEDVSDITAARFYRLFGFVLTEKGNLELAYSLYKYSLLFQEDSSVYDELTYIKQQAPDIDFYAIDYKQRVCDSLLTVLKPKEKYY